MKKKKILVLSASVGAGHMRAAESIEAALRTLAPGCEVRNVDVLKFTNPLFRRLYGKAYIDMVNSMPEVLGWMYDSLDKPWENERRRLALDRLNTGPLIAMLKRERPDFAICTHFLPSEIISWLTAREKVSFPQAIVVTDFDAHAMWLCRNYAHYFVALEETRVHLERVGIDADKITVSGIPIDPVFATVKDRRSTRLQHGLEADRFTVIVSAGGFGVGKIEPLLGALSELSTPAQVIAVCGRNEDRRNRISRLAEERLDKGNVRFHPIGFTSEMDAYMSAADLIVGKPGGLTTSEALAKGLVFCVVNPIPGQEERNSDHLLEEGCAIKCNNLPALAYKIDRLAADSGRFETMRRNALRLARPRAALEIAERVLTL
jgi:processive 1,2-diacylglycerol beta-glucosyltransferase